MDPGETVVKPKRKIWRYVLLGLVLFPLVGFTAMWLADEAAYRKARAAGVPLELEDLYDTPMPADEDNAAVGILEAGELLLRDETDATALSFWRLLEGTSEQQQIGLYEVSSHKEALEKVEEALARPQYRAIRDMSTPQAADITRGPVSRFADLLAGRLLINTKERRIQEAIRDAELLVVLQNYHGWDIHSDLWHVFYVLIDACDNDADLNALRKTIVQIEEPYFMDSVRSHIFEKVTSFRNQHLILDRIRRNKSSIDQERIKHNGLPSNMSARFQMARFIRWCTPVFKQRMDADETEAYFAKMAEPESLVDNLFYQEAADSLPHVQILRADELDIVAARTATLALVDAKKHRLQHGEWPQSLTDLPSDYIDPYTGEPLSFEVAGDKFVVWSRGSKLGYGFSASLPPDQLPPLPDTLPKPLE